MTTLTKELTEKQAEITKEIENFKNDPRDVLDLLKFMAKFYGYSARNVLLIRKQWSGAYAVGSFKYWQQLGYCVSKGEHSKIKVLVPITVKTFTALDGKRKGLKYATKIEKAALKKGQLKTESHHVFKYGNVFDITQTNVPKEDYPKLFPNRHFDYEIQPAEAINILNGLKKYANSLKCPIYQADRNTLDSAKGAYYPVQHFIKLNPRNTKGENITVLIHELGHASLHHQSTLNTSEKELQAEMISYLVSQHYGIDVEEDSTSYIAGWTDKFKDVKNLEKLLNQSQKTAFKIINTIG